MNKSVGKSPTDFFVNIYSFSHNKTIQYMAYSVYKENVFIKLGFICVNFTQF